MKESKLQPATAEMLTISMCLCVFAKNPHPAFSFFTRPRPAVSSPH